MCDAKIPDGFVIHKVEIKELDRVSFKVYSLGMDEDWNETEELEGVYSTYEKAVRAAWLISMGKEVN